ncbi:MAG: hypothetical protein AAB602_01000 [Patescibacteria group bacterium]
MMNKLSIKLVVAVVIFAVFSALAGVVLAFHSWGPYHWARTSNPFALKLGDNVSGASWDAALSVAATDWSSSTVLDTIVVAGATNPKNCKAVTGRVEVCNSKYGNNGWLGLAQIWITGGEHITKGVVKLNDTYFNTSKYNKPAWRNLVMCQEIGHTLGLDHQDEDFGNANLGTCMDYTNDPSTNQHPNAHDYEELALIYAHTDSFTTVLSSGPIGNGKKGIGSVEPDENAEFGVVLKKDGRGRPSLYGRDLGRGEKVFTFVYWAK